MTGQAKQYHKIKNFLFVVNLLISILFLLVIVVWGFSIFLRAYLRMFFENRLILNGLYFSVCYIVITILGFPLDLYEGFFLEHKFKLLKQNFLGWLKDFLKKNIIAFIISLIIVECVYIFIGKFLNSWWVFAAIFWLFITVIFTKVFPLIILPLFFKSRPLEEGILKEKISTLVENFNFKLSNVYILELSKKTVKANAMVAGLGKSKRIYLSDTVVSDFSLEEIELVVAHELTHDKNKDIYKHILVSFFVSIFCFYAADLFLNKAVFEFGYIAKDDIAGLPLLVLLLLLASLIILPFQNSFSRYMEKQADIGAIKATNNAKDFISMITKLGNKNLADFSPSKLAEIFLYDHPPISKRIDLAKNIKINV